MSLDDQQIPWREASRRADEERAAQERADWEEQCAIESVDAEERRWENIDRQRAAERALEGEVHYAPRGWIEPACRGPHDG